MIIKLHLDCSEGIYQMPAWVKLVYNLAGLWDRFFTWVSGLTQWRYRFWDSFCYCRNCQKRRESGIQEKALPDRVKEVIEEVFR